MELLSQIFEVCVIPLLGVLTSFLVKWINTKINQTKEATNNELQQKYLTMLNNTITNCVIATTQTYVESLKKQGKFDTEAQKVAFNMTYEAIISLITDEASEYLSEAIGDLQLYVKNKIEAEVNINKN